MREKVNKHNQKEIDRVGVAKFRRTLLTRAKEVEGTDPELSNQLKDTAGLNDEELGAIVLGIKQQGELDPYYKPPKEETIDITDIDIPKSKVLVDDTLILGRYATKESLVTDQFESIVELIAILSNKPVVEVLEIMEKMPQRFPKGLLEGESTEIEKLLFVATQAYLLGLEASR